MEYQYRGAWYSDRAYELAVPDLTQSYDLGFWCEAYWPGHGSCTRLSGHTGRHAAGQGDHIIAVWSDDTPGAISEAEALGNGNAN